MLRFETVHHTAAQTASDVPGLLRAIAACRAYPLELASTLF